MSSLPGLQLEDFIMWNLDIKVEDTEDANESLKIAEVLGTAIRPRPTLTQEQFKPILSLFEEYREWVEQNLADFDEDTQSWRSYASCAFEFIDMAKYREAHRMIKEITG